jgi:hypothetical protein
MGLVEVGKGILAAAGVLALAGCAHVGDNAPYYEKPYAWENQPSYPNETIGEINREYGIPDSSPAFQP